VRDAAVVKDGDHAFLLGGARDHPVSDAVVLRVTTATTDPSTAPTAAASEPWRPGQPAFDGQMLIADRGNNRLLVVDANKQVLWTYPDPTAPAPAGGFYFPDDAFFAERGTRIITNEEGNDTIVELAYPSGAIVFSYGHPRRPGRAPGYLNQPDDAY